MVNNVDIQSVDVKMVVVLGSIRSGIQAVVYRSSQEVLACEFGAEMGKLVTSSHLAGFCY